LNGRTDFPTIVKCLSVAKNDGEVRFFVLVYFLNLSWGTQMNPIRFSFF